MARVTSASELGVAAELAVLTRALSNMKLSSRLRAGFPAGARIDGFDPARVGTGRSITREVMRSQQPQDDGQHLEDHGGRLLRAEESDLTDGIAGGRSWVRGRVW
ncbi:hypothetical protein GCM10010236_11920 [Streptomyces eurythermus]|nr:hypothetical protein GCM10010236_11920 [Streptomyces eurythermus]